jgi:hypothetical protein
MEWEYRTAVRMLKDYHLNEIGQEGWELVGFTTSPVESEPRDFIFVFKRPKA